jgi:hypothetical protein
MKKLFARLREAVAQRSPLFEPITIALVVTGLIVFLAMGSVHLIVTLLATT